LSQHEALTGLLVRSCGSLSELQLLRVFQSLRSAVARVEPERAIPPTLGKEKGRSGSPPPLSSGEAGFFVAFSSKPEKGEKPALECVKSPKERR